MAIYKNRTDLHMHTLSSFDGNFTAEQMCSAAVGAGLATIAFTDHFDVDFYEQQNLGTRQQTSYEDVTCAKEIFADK